MCCIEMLPWMHDQYQIHVVCMILHLNGLNESVHTLCSIDYCTIDQCLYTFWEDWLFIENETMHFVIFVSILIVEEALNSDLFTSYVTLLHV